MESLDKINKDRHILISVHDRSGVRVGFLDNEKPKSLHYYGDSWHRYLTQGSETFDFSVYKTGQDVSMLNEENYVSFRFGQRDHFFKIRKIEETETEITCYCESTNIELLNEEAQPYEATKAMSLVEYLNIHEIIGPMLISNLTLGINEVSSKKLKLSWEGYETKLARLLSLVNSFDAECEFETILNSNGTFQQLKMNVYRKHDDEYQGVGTRIAGKTLYYGDGLDSIRRTVDISELVTAIQPKGSKEVETTTDGQTSKETVEVNLRGFSKPDVYDSDGRKQFYLKNGVIYAPQSMDRFPACLAPDSDKWVKLIWETEYSTQESLYGNALSKLKTLSEPSIEYEIEGDFDLEIGDTVIVHDDKFDPALILEVRVSEQEYCFTDPTKCRNVFSNVKALENKLSSFIVGRMKTLIDEALPVTIDVLIDGATIFKNKEGSATLSGRLMKGEKEVSASSWKWYKDGTQVASTCSIKIDASDITGSSVYRIEAVRGGKVYQKNVTMSEVRDGLGISTIKDQYTLSDSTSTNSGSTWSDEPVQYVDGKAVWSRYQITYDDGSVGYTNGAYNAVATIGYQSSFRCGALEADSAVIHGSLEAHDAHFTELETDTLNVKGRLTAAEGEIGDLTTTTLNVRERLTAAEGDITDLTSDNVTVKNRLTAAEADIGDLTAQNATITNLVAQKADITDLTAQTGRIDTLFTDLTTANTLIAQKATITDLDAATGRIALLESGKADIGDLTAVSTRTGTLEAGVANINLLLSGSTVSGSTQTIVLNAQNCTVDTAFFENLISSYVTAGYIFGDTISTNDFTIKSDDGGLEMADKTIQIKDSTRVRIQIGEDSSGDYNLYLWDEDGNLLWDAQGLTATGISRPIIKDSMVADDAGIAGSKLNIPSVVTSINNGTVKIESALVNVDGQSLNVAFNTLETKVDDIEVGGRNLLKNSSANLNSFDGWAGTSSSASTGTVNVGFTSDGYGGQNALEVNISDSSTATYTGRLFALSTSSNFTQALEDISAGEQICMSGWYYIDSDVNYTADDCNIFIREAYSNNTTYQDMCSFKVPSTTKDSWVRFYSTATVKWNPSDHGTTPYTFRCAFNNRALGHIKFSQIKVERGNKPTDWTPAPEDVEDKITTQTTQISVIQGQISSLITDVEQLNENKADGSQVTTLTNNYNSLRQTVDGTVNDIGSLQTTIATKADNSTVTTIQNNQATLSNTVDGLSQRLTSAEASIETKADGSTVETIQNNFSSLSNTVDGLSTSVGTVTTTVNGTIASSITLFYSSDSTSVPALPTSKVTSTSTGSKTWTTVVPTYNASYPYLYTCMQQTTVAGNVTWTKAVSGSYSNYVGSVNTTAKAGIAETATLFYAKANNTAPSKPTSAVTTNSASTYNAWNKTLPTYSASYPYLYLCTQTLTNGGAYAWTNVTTGSYADFVSSLSAQQTSLTTTVNGISGKVTNLVSAVGANSDGTLTTSVVDQISEVRQTASSISQSVTDLQTSFDGLSVGGRNLILSSETQKLSAYSGATLTFTGSQTVSEWNASNAYRVTGAKGTNNTFGTLGTGRSSAYNPSGVSVSGQGYVHSIYIKNDGDPLRITNNLGGDVTVASGETKRVVISGTGNGTQTLQFIFYDTAGTNIDFAYWHPKIETGNTATDWTPAPEDTDSTISGLTSRISTAESKITPSAITLSVTESLSDGSGTLSAGSTFTLTKDACTIDGAKFIISGTGKSLEESLVTDVGGINLLDNSSFTRGDTSGWIIPSTSEADGTFSVNRRSATGSYSIENRPYLSFYRTATGTSTGRSFLMNNSATDLIKLGFKAGDDFTLSGYIFIDSDSYQTMTGTLQVFCRQNESDSSSTYAETGASVTYTTSAPRRRWMYFETTGKVQYTNGGKFTFCVGMSGTVGFLLSSVKIERGTKATKWSASENDVKHFSLVDWCVDNDTTVINGAKIATGTIDADKIAANSITTDKIAAKAITANELATGCITAASGIIASIDASKITTGTLDAERIAAGSLSVGQLGDLQVGGRNLILKSDSQKVNAYGGANLTFQSGQTVDDWKASDAYRVTGTKGTSNLFAVLESGRSSSNNPNAKSINGQNYTHSIYVKNLGDPVQIRNNGLSDTVVTVGTNEVTRAVLHGVGNGVNNLQFTLNIGNGTNIDFIYWHPKIEAGNVVTDWTPAPEDVDTDIDDAKSMADDAQDTASTALSTASNALTEALTSLDRLDELDPLVQQTVEDASKALANLKTWTKDGTQTMIDGGKIYTGTITADKIYGDTLASVKAVLGDVKTGSISSPNGHIKINLYDDNAGIQIKNSTLETTLHIDANGTWVTNKGGDTIAKFTSSGTETADLTATGTSLLSGLKIEKQSTEVWISYGG